MDRWESKPKTHIVLAKNHKDRRHEVLFGDALPHIPVGETNEQIGQVSDLDTAPSASQKHIIVHTAVGPKHLPEGTSNGHEGTVWAQMTVSYTLLFIIQGSKMITLP